MWIPTKKEEYICHRIQESGTFDTESFKPAKLTYITTIFETVNSNDFKIYIIYYYLLLLVGWD
jgi:hypothetical protein